MRDFVIELLYQYRMNMHIIDSEVLRDDDIEKIVGAFSNEIRKEIYKQEGIVKKIK